MSGSNAVKLMKFALTNILSKETGTFNAVLNKCKFVEGDLGRIVVSLKVEREHCNLYGTLHGGLSAVLVDTISTLALITDDEKSTAKLGVSVDMHMSYLKAAKIGEEILINAKVLRQGRTLAYLDCELRNRETNELLVKGSHTKFVGRS